MSGLNRLFFWLIALVSVGGSTSFADGFWDDDDSDGSNYKQTKEEGAEYDDGPDYEEVASEEEGSPEGDGFVPFDAAYDSNMPPSLSDVNSLDHEPLRMPEGARDAFKGTFNPLAFFGSSEGSVQGAPLVASAPSHSSQQERQLSEEVVKEVNEEANSQLIEALKGRKSPAKTKQVEAALMAGANPNLIFTGTTTVLMRAASRGDVKIATLLMRFGADPSIRNKVRNTALAVALNQHRNVGELVDALLDDYGNGSPDSGLIQYTLSYAVYLGNLAVIELLHTRYGASLDSRCCFGSARAGWRTQLGQLAFQGNIEGVQLLLRLGAGFSVVQGHVDSVLDSAVNGGDIEIIKLLLAAGVGIEDGKFCCPSAQILAARRGREDVLQLFFEYGADVDCRDADGVTALMEAARSGRLGVVKWLLDLGASVDALCVEGLSVLMYALDYIAQDEADDTCLKIIKVLIGQGARVDYMTDKGMTLLRRAMGDGNVKVVKFLLNDARFEGLFDMHAQGALEAAVDSLSSSLWWERAYPYICAIKELVASGLRLDLGAALLRFYEAFQLERVPNAVNLKGLSCDIQEHFCSALFGSELGFALRSVVESGISLENFKRLFDALDFKYEGKTIDYIENGPRLYELLQSAILQGNLEIFKFLMDCISSRNERHNAKYYVDLGRRNPNGETLIDLALRNGGIEWLKALMDPGFTVFSRGTLTFGVFESLIRIGDIETLKYFLSFVERLFECNGGRVNLGQLNPEGESIINLALRTGDLAFFKTLIGPEAVYFSAECLTPELFESVVLTGDIATLQYFLSIAGRVKLEIDFDRQNSEGATLLDLAYQNGFEGIVTLLTDNGANSDLGDDLDELPHECAPQEGDVPAVPVSVDQPRPTSVEDEPQAKRQRTDSGEEIQGGEDQESEEQDSIFAPTNARKSWGRKAPQ